MSLVYVLLGVLLVMSAMRTFGVNSADAKSLQNSDYKAFLKMTHRKDCDESWNKFLDMMYKG